MSASQNFFALMVLCASVLPACAQSPQADQTGRTAASTQKAAATNKPAKPGRTPQEMARVKAMNADFERIAAMSGGYSTSQKFDEGIAEMTRRLKARPNDTDSLLTRAMIKIAKKDKVGAMADADAAIKINSKLYYAYFIRSIIDEMAGDTKRALWDMTKAHELSKYRELMRKRGQIHYRAGNYQEAVTDLTSGLDKFQIDAPEAYFYLYKSHSALKDYKAAKTDAMAMVEQNPKVASRHEILGDAAVKAGDATVAATAYRKASELYLRESLVDQSEAMRSKAAQIEKIIQKNKSTKAK